ncbi:MAG: phospho-sugar mutase [Bacteroidales bacterium]|nr:phospho-sugar mutase [Bacteroidales bacterium]
MELNIDITAQENVQKWLNGNYDEETKEAIRKMIAENQNELNESFYKSLEFGTGGLRGIMGVGTNRMNKYTVAMATQGLANYVISSFKDTKNLKAAVAYDCRNNSPLFAKITASVLAANGIHVYLFDKLRPTPELSFAVRQLGCQVGVMITASHNPKEYNGYKAYWNDGGQFVAPHDTNVIDEVLKIKSLEDIKMSGNEDNIEIIGEDIDKIYLDRVEKNCLLPDVIRRHKDIKIVYTPLHGTGVTLVPAILQRLGFTNVTMVKEQAINDGNFPTVKSPNPEEKSALEMAIALAKDIDADIVMATDPDADRVGIAVKRKDGQWMLLNGNQTASVLTYYLVNQWKVNNKLIGKEFIVKTIVTSELIKDIAERNGVKSYDVLTGFKFIADKIKELEGKEVFIGGGEESYGYMIGDFVRDKDAVSTCAMIAEIAAWAADNGKTFFDVLIDLYKEYGFYKEDLLSMTKKGKSGNEEIKQMMVDYRSNPPKEIAGSKVVCIKDYQLQTSTNLQTGDVESIVLPKSNVLQFFTEDGSKVSVRPSGTEPKIKFYFGVKGKLTNPEDFDAVNNALDSKIKAIKTSLNLE